MESSTEVQTCEPRCTSQLVEQFINNWHWKLALLCYSIEVVVVNTKALGIILLLD